MHFQVFQKLMVVMLLLSLLVSGDQSGESVLDAIDGHSPGVRDKKPVENQQHAGSQRLRSSFYVFFSSKRKVPHSSDPLHNR
ncbi:hypothetical protein V6N13_065630 [Hibiscus sabdariffa]|uniref:Uncharacterized protein n=1 Tax=Hibiscus sabdariffa TaxID=183260 RepID=A0ABR2QQA4_9ROSI